MSGILVPVLEKQVFDFSSLAASATRTITIHRALNVIPFYYASLYVRLHTLNIPSGSGSIAVAAYTTDPSGDDPQEFLIAGAATLSVSAATASTVGSILTVATANNFGPYFKIVVTGTQNVASALSLYAELSADLLLREA